MSDRFGSDQTGGSSYQDEGNIGDLDDQRFGTPGGATGIDWTSVAASMGAYIDTIDVDIDFSSSASKDVVVPLGQEVRIVALGRLYIDQDPGGAFDQWTKYTFYNKSTMKGYEGYYRSVVKMAYTELAVATTGLNANIVPDDHTLFSEVDLIHFVGTNAFARIATLASTMVAEDNVGAYPIDTGLSRVSEFSGVSLFNAEKGTDTYFRVSFETPQTVSLKLNLVVIK